MTDNPKLEPYWLKGLGDAGEHQRRAEAVHDPVLAFVLDRDLTLTPDEVVSQLSDAARLAVFAPLGSDEEQEALAHLAYVMATVVDAERPMSWVKAQARKRPKLGFRARVYKAWLALRYGA